ncbi:Bgt-50185, partial [Blumeria graminis f. sp. tritici]
MKFLSISGVTMLCSILAPVNSMSNIVYPQLLPDAQFLPVPNPNQAFSYSCPDGRRHDKNTLENKARIGKQGLDDWNFSHGYPEYFHELNYNINGDKWFYPIDDNHVDFVVFTETGRVVGVVFRAQFDNRRSSYHPCVLEI